jgi:hypothetical protein
MKKYLSRFKRKPVDGNKRVLLVEEDEWEGELSYHGQTFLIHLDLRPHGDGWDMRVQRQDGSILAQSSHATGQEAVDVAEQLVRQSVDEANNEP